jgi:hypothetical protein
MTTELEPCPWCRLEYQGHFQLPGGAWVRYTVPDKHAPSCPVRCNGYATEAELVAAWNTRPSAPPIGDEAGDLRAALARIAIYSGGTIYTTMEGMRGIAKDALAAASSEARKG